jgi:hypothetical protein
VEGDSPRVLKPALVTSKDKLTYNRSSTAFEYFQRTQEDKEAGRKSKDRRFSYSYSLPFLAAVRLLLALACAFFPFCAAKPFLLSLFIP